MVRMSNRSRVKPRLKAQPRTTPFKASTIVKDGKRVLQAATTKMEQAQKLRDDLAHQPIKTLVGLASKAAGAEKTPVGANGKNLLPVDARSIVINGGATGDVTSSMSMYMYRPPRKRSVNSIQYAMKTMASRTIGSVENAQALFDIDILDGVGVKSDNPGDGKYSNLTVKRAFDNYIQTAYKNLGDTALAAKIQQTAIHFKSLTSELIITNNNDSSMMVDVYELVPQHTLGPSERISESLADGYMSPRYTFEQGLTGGDDSDVIFTDDQMPATSIAANPFNSTVFSRTWKVVKQLRLNITGKSTHRHKSVYEINKTVSYQEMAQFSPDGGKFAGWNPTFLCIQKGVPAYVLSSTKEAISTNSTYVCNMQLNYESNPESQAKVIVFDAHT